jgi:hypothetical protein
MTPLKTRFLLLTITILLFSSGLNAQTANSREIGLRLWGLNDFDFIYKKQLSDNSYRRLRVALANVGFGITDEVNNYSIRAGVAWGKEHRRPVAEDLLWVHGWEPRFSFGFEMLSYRDEGLPGVDQDTWELSVNPGIGYVLGFQYNVSDRFYVSLESIPSFGLNFTSQKGDALNSLGVGANFSFASVALTLAYSFVPTGGTSSSQ